MKELLDIATAAIREITEVSNPDFRLEQAVYNKESHDWEVVVSYLVKNTNSRQHPFGFDLPTLQLERIYQKLRINDDRKVTGLYMFDSRA